MCRLLGVTDKTLEIINKEVESLISGGSQVRNSAFDGVKDHGGASYDLKDSEYGIYAYLSNWCYIERYIYIYIYIYAV